MKTYFELSIPANKRRLEQKIFFGRAVTDEELKAVYALRYEVYSHRGYIEPSRYPAKEESDHYDSEGKSIHFAAFIDGKALACIRVIVDDPLPTEKAFTFEEPFPLKNISRQRRGELGRFIIIPPDRENKIFFPRGLVMLFILATLSKFGEEENIQGGYSFIKESLKKKLERLSVPFHPIYPHEEHYPKDGVLARYFNQPEDPVIPMYYLTSECLVFTARKLKQKILFRELGNGRYELRPLLYHFYMGCIRLLRSLG